VFEVTTLTHRYEIVKGVSVGWVVKLNYRLVVMNVQLPSSLTMMLGIGGPTLLTPILVVSKALSTSRQPPLSVTLAVSTFPTWVILTRYTVHRCVFTLPSTREQL